MVTSATPGLPMITVAAGALIRRIRAMLTLTLIGSSASRQRCGRRQSTQRGADDENFTQDRHGGTRELDTLAKQFRREW